MPNSDISELESLFSKLNSTCFMLKRPNTTHIHLGMYGMKHVEGCIDWRCRWKAKQFYFIKKPVIGKILTMEKKEMRLSGWWDFPWVGSNFTHVNVHLLIVFTLLANMPFNLFSNKRNNKRKSNKSCFLANFGYKKLCPRNA